MRYGDQLGYLATKGDAGQRHAGEQAHSQAVGEQHHRRVASWDAADSADVADRASVIGIDRNHDHHARQGGDRDLIHPREKRGQAVTAATAHVHHHCPTRARPAMPPNGELTILPMH